MSEANGHRWSKFWWQDWANDPALRSCSLAAQGLWMRLLCIMHEATPRGHLVINGKPPTSKQLATITGATLKELGVLLRELRDAGVYSHDLAGTVYSRRMVRDTAASERGLRTGRLGGNPTLRPKGNGTDHPSEGLTPPVNPSPYPDPLTPPVMAPRYRGTLTPKKQSTESEAEPPPNPPRDRGGRRQRFKNPAFEIIATQGFETVRTRPSDQENPSDDNNLAENVADFLRLRGLRHGAA